LNGLALAVWWLNDPDAALELRARAFARLRHDGRDTEATRLRYVRAKPVPFPPEPLRWAGITLTRRALARADRREGRRGPWLRVLDRLGMGFDS